jgi:hypothetical protein
MWAHRIVILFPEFNNRSSMIKTQKPVHIQELIANSSVKAFNKGIIHRPTGFIENQLDIMLTCLAACRSNDREAESKQAFELPFYVHSV